MDNFEFPRSDSAIFVETDIFLDLEDALDLNGAIVGQRGKPNCTPGPNTLLWTKHLKIVFPQIFYQSQCKPPSWGWRTRWWWWCTRSPLSSRGLRSPYQMSSQSSPPWVNITTKMGENFLANHNCCEAIFIIHVQHFFPMKVYKLYEIKQAKSTCRGSPGISSGWQERTILGTERFDSTF